ncbi:MAG TPA: hypothetical protein VL486_14705 [Verrucomicrobiae bacterium]|nr:hypothetical protein [Verrucomicrobiae bacterium]
MKVSLLLLATLLLIMPRAYSDSVTLKTGEVVEGEILSETDTDLVIMAVYHGASGGQMSSRRTIPKSEIAKVDRETTEQKVARRAFEALRDRLRLDPNRELSKTDYEGGIQAFTDYLKSYPGSKFTDEVQKRLAAWQDELAHVEHGEVKFADKWMTPDEKHLELLKKQLADFQRQQSSVAAEVDAAKVKIAGLERKLDTLQNTRLPDGRVIPNPERGKAEADIMACAGQINAGNPKLASLDVSIQKTKAEIEQVQQAQEAALAKTNQPPVQAAAVQPTAPPPPPPPPPQPEPWFAKNWKKLAIGGGILLGLLILATLLKYVLGMSARVEAARDQNRRLARAELKKVFDRILADGERPPGENTPEGEIVPIGKGEDASGGGRWFVIGDAYIWAVQNNGRDGDNWELNNVVTQGRGAIGARVAMDPELADYINSVSNAAQ